MTRSARFLLFSLGSKLLALPLVGLLLAVYYQITGGGEFSRYGESIAALLLMLLVMFSASLGSWGAPHALSLGGRRRDIFWGIQACCLTYALCTTLVVSAANVVTGIARWPVLHLSPQLLLFYLLCCYVISLTGTLAGLLVLRRRALAVVLFCFLILFSLACYFPILIYSRRDFHLWGILPGLMPVILVAVWLLGEFFLSREMRNLCVR